jgi:hypothetical protein
MVALAYHHPLLVHHFFTLVVEAVQNFQVHLEVVAQALVELGTVAMLLQPIVVQAAAVEQIIVMVVTEVLA